MKPTYLDAVYNLLDDKVHGGASDGPISEITLHDGQTPPTESAIQSKLVELISAWDRQEYARNRATAFPSTGDQLDMMMKDMKNNTTTHREACEAVKAKFPKSE